jgi:uncharacterized protein
MQRRLVRWLWLLAALTLPVVVCAADAAPPKLARHVTDLTGTLTAAQVDTLDAQLVALEKGKGAQLVVLMVATTAPADLESYSLAVAEANKVGREGPDDGALMLVVKDDRRVRIEVGYGLEGAIPDVTANRIIREYVTPRFRAGDYNGGITDAVSAMTKIIDGETLPPPLEDDQRHANAGDWGQGIFIALFAAIFLRRVFGKSPWWVRLPFGGLVSGAVVGVILASLGAGIVGAILGGGFMLLPFGAGRSIGGGGWGGFGGGGFGGGGGGGFSGGGGSFGGGGASGSW